MTPGLGLLACREDVGDDRLVGHRQSCAELALQVTGAREEMRLEDGDDALVGAARRRLQRRGDLGGMVGVVVDDDHSGGATDLLEAACGAAERSEMRRRLGQSDAGVSEGGERRQRVHHVVFAGYAQLDAPQALAALAHDELAAAIVGALDVGPIVAGADPVGQHRGRGLGGQEVAADPRGEDEAPSGGNRRTKRRNTSWTSRRLR